MKSWSSALENYDSGKPRCYMSHPPLEIIEGLVIYGGSCVSPVMVDADIYVGFDIGMKRSKLAYPWEEGESFLFPIPDMGVPADVDQFRKLVDWLSVQLIAKKKVHLGCIGGHGRTGMVLSALVKLMRGDVDSTTYVRKNYCQKAVESEEQINFLKKHFGIKPVDAWKSRLSPVSHQMGGGVIKPVYQPPFAANERKVEKVKYEAKAVTGKGLCLWGEQNPFRRDG